MRTALLIWIFAATPYDARDAKARYELKCLYCHSGNVIEDQRRSVNEWRKVFERMHRRAPLLLSGNDLRVLFRYVTVDLALATRAPRVSARRPVPPPGVAADPTPPEVPEPVEEFQAPPRPVLAESPRAPEPAPEEAPARDVEAETQGPLLLEEKCSKCHPLQRVFTKLDSVDKGVSAIERMRRKTGSGISREDAELLERFVRSQF